MKLEYENVAEPGDRYEFGEILGFGVNGKVYCATDGEENNKKVAIKVQKYEEVVKDYAEAEYKVLRDLSDKTHLVEFYGVYRKDTDIWFILELCEGGPVIDLVQDLLARNRRLAEEHIAHIIKETVKALIYLHENNVIHRDVKGSNILLTREGEVKLCDFGSSQTLKNKDQRLSTRLGSPCWMAPELVSANSKKKTARYDNRVDVWAIGITAIELAEGKAPFQDMHPTRVLFQIVANPPPSLQKLSYWSDNYHDFISECLAKYYDYRPYMMEIFEHPFLETIPENNYHLSLEIKTLLSDIKKTDPANKSVEINIHGRFLKKGVDGKMEPMYEEDLAAFPAITESIILKLLEKRVEAGEHYSFIGDILLYLNPNQEKDIYGREFHRKYSFKSRSENAPHIYSIGDTAYQNALHHSIPQQIVFSGETGSGKTTNYLHILDHLFYLGENPSINSERIRNAVKLIHSLIHASTPANDYSTRSVFKTTISYGKTGKLSGASFKVHCLEKWRVSSMDTTQSNFHFVYYIYDGLVAADSAEVYKLNSNREYRYLRVSEESKTGQPKDNIDQNIVKYRKLNRYLKELEFSDEQINTIVCVIAAILNIGETRFHEDDDNIAVLDNQEAVDNFSELLEVDSKKISWALANYCLVHEGRAIRRKNSCEEARDIRDVLANTLYARLVDFIIGLINDKLSIGAVIFGEKYIIKLIDYFGFECFKQNNLSQLMVNCLNEQLQYHFSQRLFSWEVMDLQTEELEFTPITYYNNKDTLNELLSKPEGVLSIIDDASKKGRGGRYVTGNIYNQEKIKVAVMDALEFSVAHYTGKVTYNAREMPVKNRDFLPPELIETMRNSQNPIIKMLFTNKLDKTGNLIVPLSEAKKNADSSPSKIPATEQFSQTRKMRTQIAIFRSFCLELLKELSVGSGSGGTHFVRCIRTDLKRRPQYFQKDLVRQQLRALVVVETAKARQQGYPHRISFPEFLRRYKFLAFDFEENVELTKENCRLLMIRLKMEGWTLGKTKIFLKYYNEEYLSRLYETQVKKIIKIQSILRGFITKCRINKQMKTQEKQCVEGINKQRRGSLMTEDEAAGVIQKAYRRNVKSKDIPGVYQPLKEKEISLIRPFALKWKNKNIFYVLMRYRAIKLQDFFNLSHQVHFYNLNAFHYTQQCLNGINLNGIDKKAKVAAWLGDNVKSVLKLKFHLEDIPFYDTSHMYDQLTNLGAYESEDCWDIPYRWREAYSNENMRCLKTADTDKVIANMDYNRDPNAPIRPLSSPFEDTDATASDFGADYKNDYQSPEAFEVGSDENMEKDDSIAENVYQKNWTSSQVKSGKYDSCDQIERFRKNNVTKKDVPQIGVIDLKKVYKNVPTQEVYITNTKPANKDFDYIKPSPRPVKHKPVADPITELRNIARRDNASDDDPPFNFQGMLRKTNFRRDSLNNALARKDSVRNMVDVEARRDSLKNAFVAMRRFSISREHDKDESILINGYEKRNESVVGTPVTMEILPGLFIDGLEVEL